MRRSVIGILLSVVTFGIGFGVASIQWRSTTDAPPPTQTFECPDPVAPRVEAPKLPQTTTSSEFIPQITELQDFEDMEFDDFKAKLIDTHEHENVYRKSEVIAKNGEQWIGLFEKNDKVYLKKTSVKVKFDPTYEGYGDEDYMRLTTANNKKPIFLLKNVRNLKVGSVESNYLRPSYEEMERRRLYDKPTEVGFEEFYQVGGKEYSIRVNRGLTKNGQKVVAMILSLDETTQAVNYLPYNSDKDTVGHIVWVGDLDGDKKLDLYMDHDGYESCGFSSALFLSSAAKKGELVRQVASFGTAGC